jgi:hypothetical protein
MTDVNHITTIRTVITLPAQTIHLGDLMDRAMDNLRTAHLALGPDNDDYLDDIALTSIWATINQVLRDLQPVRDSLQGVAVRQ